MSNTRDYFLDNPEIYTPDSGCSVVTSYVVHCNLHRSSPAQYDDDEMISYPTLEEAEKAFSDACANAKRFVEAALQDRILGNSELFSSANVSLCVDLDVILRLPSDFDHAAELSWTGSTSDGLYEFDVDHTDFTDSWTRHVDISIYDYPDMDPYVDVIWTCGEIEIPANTDK